MARPSPSQAFSLISVAGLALGLACCLVVIVHVEEEARFDAFHRDVDSLYLVVRQMPDVHGPSTRKPLGPVLAESYPEIEAAVRSWRLQEPATFRVGDRVSAKRASSSPIPAPSGCSPTAP